MNGGRLCVCVCVCAAGLGIELGQGYNGASVGCVRVFVCRKLVRRTEERTPVAHCDRFTSTSRYRPSKFFSDHADPEDTFVYTPDGIYRLPDKYIKVGNNRDMPNRPVTLSLRNWLEMRGGFASFSSTCFCKPSRHRERARRRQRARGPQEESPALVHPLEVSGDKSITKTAGGISWQISSKHAQKYEMLTVPRTRLRKTT